ncbi:MAG: nucleotidyltransferase family protein [Candidatus Micrarchaeota archaeon]|nr:nucleotidyltransferase family protein [Candidatus Micrarchaeota archaeon]MDE1834140.1 nucleotidyltransferase family protein [Candidatus Micrarchaeota archaeon]MDE1859533.1 nucleotidyltransferase family protein [Candidatus Micrarchaeota archaeon]
MLALIMAGGFGKRLRPLTNKVPKPLVKVGGKPIIYWQIKWLESFGVDRFALLGGYKASKLKSYIKSIGYSNSFEFSIEKEPLGTGGAIRNAYHLLENEKSFLVSNGDNVTDQDVTKLKLGRRYLGCISLVPYRSSKGIVEFDGDRVVRFDEKPLIKGYWYNAGAALLSNKVLNMLPEKGSLEQELYPILARKGMLSCVKFDNSYFSSVDSLKDLEEVDRDLKSGKISF